MKVLLIVFSITPQEANISINKGVPNNTIHYVLEKITLIDNAIILKRVD
jgi:hypothetical protein